MTNNSENFEGFDVGHAVLLYGVCDRGWLDFTPKALKLFRYRGLTEQEIAFLNCARWIKVAGMRLVEADEREHRRLHYVIVGKPDDGGGPPGGEDPDTGPDGFEMSIADLIRIAHEDDAEEKPETSPGPLVQPVAPSLPSPTAKPLARPIRKRSGPEID